MTVRKIIEINEERCDGCGQCILDCAENALAIVDGKAKVISDVLCDGLGACLQGCPQDALTIIERDALPFDQAAVDALQKSNAPSAPIFSTPIPSMPLGKNTRNISSSISAPTCPSVQAKANEAPWPLKLRILPIESPFLKGAEILLVSDCAPAIYTDFHKHFEHKVKISCCPKFEDPETLEQKLTDIILLAQPKSLEILRMEVPCCGALMPIVERAKQKATHLIPKFYICSRQGNLLEKSLLS